MNESEFLQRMEFADQELAQNQVPSHARTFRAFRLLTPDYAGPLIGYSVRSEEYPEFVGPNLLDKYVFRGSEAPDPGDIWTLTMKVAGDGVYQDWERGHPAQPARLP
jgi:hypothetical protein